MTESKVLDTIKAVCPEEWDELAEWTDKWSDRSQNADPGQREDCIIYIQREVIDALAAAVEERDKELAAVREVAERITQEGNTIPLDPLWLYERMCEVIEVIDGARGQA